MIADYSLVNSSFTILNSYTWGMDMSGSMQGAGGLGGLLQVTDHSSPSTENFFPTYDGNDNVSEYLSTTGAVVAHYEYDTFGNEIVAATSGSLAQNVTHRFSTKYIDAETGFYYYGYRYYDPKTGRWPSRDPIQEKGGLSLYGFVFNNSIARWDVLGQFAPVYWENRPVETFRDITPNAVIYDWEGKNERGPASVGDLDDTLGLVTVYLSIECSCQESGGKWCHKECHVEFGIKIHLKPIADYVSARQAAWAESSEIDHVLDALAWHRDFINNENSELSEELGNESFDDEGACIRSMDNLLNYRIAASLLTARIESADRWDRTARGGNNPPHIWDPERDGE